MAFQPKHLCSFILYCGEELCSLPSFSAPFTGINGVTESPLRSLHWCLHERYLSIIFEASFEVGSFLPYNLQSPVPGIPAYPTTMAHLSQGHKNKSNIALC